MKIIVDGFGGDNAPLEPLKGCAMAAEEYGVEILLTGKRDVLEKTAADNGISLKGIEILEASQVVTMEDPPKAVLRAKKDSSMAVGLRALSEGKGDAFVSGGSTGALVMGSMMALRCVEGIKRPALAPILPTTKGCYMLLDVGANVECRPGMLLQFGVMGSIYLEKILHIKNPRIGVVNIGTEEHKGGELQQKAYALLKDSGLPFAGNVEARQLPFGACDVAVADGFTGNIVLKLTEGLGMAFAESIKKIFMRNALSKLAALLVLPGVKEFKKQMDYTEYGGAPLMGLTKPVIKAHGSSNAYAFKNAVRQSVAFVTEGVIDEIKKSLPAQAGEDGDE